MSDETTIRVYDRRAADYAALNDGANAADPHLSAFIAALNPGSRVLDLGCGPGIAAAAMARAGLLVDAWDASSAMVALAARHPGVDARQAVFDDIAGTDIHDGIWANFSLLHAPRADFPRHLAALHRALKPGGRFHIGMKRGTGSARDGIDRLYTYYETEELDAFLADAGFTILGHDFGSGKGMDGVEAAWVTVSAHG